MSARLPMRPRGQAVLELSIGLLVLVTVILFGIYFAEVGYLSLKVHEAAAAALWDTTARPMHEHPNDYRPRKRSIRQSEREATRAYAGFDGRTSARDRTSVVQVLTRGWDLQVRCQEDPRLLRMRRERLDPFPGGDGGMRCTASARLGPRSEEFSERFLDQGDDGFFQTRHAAGPSVLDVCALGRSRRGGCGQATFALLLDEWALSGRDESRECALGDCENKAYRRLVESMYDDAMRGAGARSAEAFARALVQRPLPGKSTRTFHMSFHDGSQGDPGYTPGDKDPGNWMTNIRTGNRNIRYYDRGQRFLGRGKPL
jgi:hypothetical protein